MGEADYGELVSALVQFIFSSVVMVLGNKKAVMALPMPCVLVIVQAVGTVLLLAALPYCRRAMVGVSVATAVSWLPIAGVFSFMLLSSLKSFQHSGVATVLIFRNIGAIVSTLVEVATGKGGTSVGVLASEAVIVVGATMYGQGAVDFSWLGLQWIMLNVCGQVAYGVTLTSKMASDDAVKKLTKFDMSLLNNTLCLPMIAAVALYEGETLEGAKAAFSAMDAQGWGFVALTCATGFLISTSGFGLQKLVSASTFIVVNNLAKFINILLGVVLLGERVNGAVGLGGCLVALLGGCWYSFETAKVNEAKKKAKKA